MDRVERRALLETRADPDPRMDYVVTLAGRLMEPAGRVRLRYVPDRLILAPAAFGAYLQALAGLPWENLEQAAAAILDDIANETVARWVQVMVEAEGSGLAGVTAHRVVIEDRQPKWDNPALLARMGTD